MKEEKSLDELISSQGSLQKRASFETKEISPVVKPPRKRRKWLKITGLVIGVILLGALAWFLSGSVSALYKIITKNRSGGAPILSFLGNVSPQQLKGEGDGRVNILLLGLAGGNYPGPELTDTIIVASYDPKNNEVALLSIPRDLYVKIPGYGYNKINSAYSLGEEASRQKKNSDIDGASLAKETVSDLLDLPIHYYLRMDFDGFKKLVDELGGVDVNVEKDIVDTLYPTENYRYTTYKITKGPHHLDGEEALKYARSRESTSDFDRAKRQQQILYAMKEKAVSLKVLANPKKLSDLTQILGDHLRTDMQVWEIERLASLASGISQEKVITKVLDDSANGPLADAMQNGIFILEPKAGLTNYTEIQRIAHEIFTDPFLREENAKILILNATGQAGIASKTATTLTSYGYQVVGVSNLAEAYPKTTIYDFSGGTKPFTLEFLSKRIDAIIREGSYTANYPAQIVIVLGDDFKGFKIKETFTQS